MIHCTLILMASLPAGWLVVGIGLIVITVVSLLLCVFKWSEATMLKKEVFELRDTMRMMRYEEANLARMLHTVEKQEVVPASSVDAVDAQVEEEPLAEEVAVDETIMEEPVAVDVPADSPVVEESVVEVPVVEESVVEEPAVEEPVVAPVAVEESVDDDVPVVEESVVPPVAVVEEPVVSKPRKQAINERRPAIPNDLFAAWFEENEPIEPEKSVPETVTESEEIAGEEVKPAQEVPVMLPVTDTPVAEASVVASPEPALDDCNIPLQAEGDIPEATEVSEMSKEDERFCRKLERIVNARMRNPNLNIDVIAAQFGIGRTNFYRKVRELMDISPNDYLRKCRMERAAELLLSTDMNIAEVCTQVGIPDAQYFSRVFKAHFGMPPSAYREQG